MKIGKSRVIFAVVASMLIFPFILSDSVNAQVIPDWVKQLAKFYGDDQISEGEFLNAIKFLIQSGIIEIPEEGASDDTSQESLRAEIIMPNGNAEQSNTGFFLPLNLQVKAGTTVVWVNDDNVLHTVQSQDIEGNPTGLFNSNVLDTGERFAFTFDDPGTYSYFCTLHPWRVGQVTVV